ncbi:hypothetical protein GCM10022243_37120 [Saccharothrix violaceirubra]|uniref:Prenyltransferase/squalene oxidase-like repeat protein n=1 Tax=Saccharothrix violaceirubra TaxID=413306 RepID=A0A7W7T4E8_9PSEU|nr:prenyltransferase/squalene oxidase repeat-containing protein [Saccharothrix violaceirubra]MBB4966373.1 hypothetical protein [Saccharothrix violaceirubra]
MSGGRSLTALLCVVGLLSGATGVASATLDDAAANSRWLAARLSPDGTLENPLGGALPDHGLMIDVLFALTASGERARAEPIVGYLDGHAKDYFTWDGLAPGSGFDAIIVGGATAKVLVAAQVAGRDPRAFGGYDMVAETLATIRRSGPDIGRISDYTKNPDFADFIGNNANVFGQALGVVGLAAAGASDRPAIDKLVTQQCAEGYFRIFFALVPTDETGDHVTPDGHKVSSCDEGKAFGVSPPDGDATAMGLSALLAARATGEPGLDEPVSRAVEWLRANQKPDGGWGGGVGTEAANTNSTGLAVQALAAAGGADAAVVAGTAFLKSAQVSAADPGPALTDQVGAIAYTPADYQAARTGGIVGVDTWIRAGAQASLGLSRVSFLDLALGRRPSDPPPVTASPTVPAPPPAPPRAPAPVTVIRTAAPAPVAAAPPATRPDTVTGRLAAYLAGGLVGGDHVEVEQDGGRFVDYDATADVVLALRTLGGQDEAVARASRFLLRPESIRAYAHGEPYETGSAYAEPLAKLSIVARFLRADGARDVDGVVDETTRSLATRVRDGDVVDTGANGTPDTTRRAWGITARTAAGADASDARRELAESQCADGLFPVEQHGKPCAKGDLRATSVAAVALNSGPEPSAEVTVALVRAAKALTARTGDDGLVAGPDRRPDLALSAAAASGRQAAGLDASDTARALALFAREDGGFAAEPGGPSDFATSLAAAPGVAGRSWTAVAGAPVTPALRLPLDEGGARATVPVAQALPVWFPPGFAAFALLVAVGFGLRRAVVRRQGRVAS